MDFIMRAWKKPEGTKKRIWAPRMLIAILLLVPLPGQSETQGIVIRYVTGTMIEDIYMVNANIDYLFSAEARKALDHGVPLHFETRITVKNQRHLLWDKSIIVILLKYKLHYQPLSGYYLVTNLDNDDRQQFQDLDDATNYMGKLKNYPLITRNALNVDAGEYYGMISARLDIKSLPAPLLPLAYLSPQWRLSSPVYKWGIQP